MDHSGTVSMKYSEDAAIASGSFCQSKPCASATCAGKLIRPSAYHSGLAYPSS